MSEFQTHKYGKLQIKQLKNAFDYSVHISKCSYIVQLSGIFSVWGTGRLLAILSPIYGISSWNCLLCLTDLRDVAKLECLQDQLLDL